MEREIVQRGFQPFNPNGGSFSRHPMSFGSTQGSGEVTLSWGIWRSPCALRPASSLGIWDGHCYAPRSLIACPVICPKEVLQAFGAFLRPAPFACWGLLG